MCINIYVDLFYEFITVHPILLLTIAQIFVICTTKEALSNSLQQPATNIEHHIQYPLVICYITIENDQSK